MDRQSQPCIISCPLTNTTIRKGRYWSYGYCGKSFMKSSKDKNGFMPTVQQIVDEINVPEHEVKATLEELEKSGRIKITDIDRKSVV